MVDLRRGSGSSPDAPSPNRGSGSAAAVAETGWLSTVSTGLAW